MRLFVGIPVEGSASEALSAAIAHLKPSLQGLRWSLPKSWHITLQFLGNTNEGMAKSLVERLGRTQAKAVHIALTELGYFERPGILFVGVRLGQDLATLQQSVVAATAPLGFLPETRPYQPHITLARAKGRLRERELEMMRTQLRSRTLKCTFVADRFLLYQSFTEPSGSRYEVLESFPLELS